MSEVIDRDRAEVLATLAELGGKLTAEEDIVFEGTRLIIPAKMNINDAINYLREKNNEDERTVTYSRTFNYRPWDGAHATLIALRRTFGMVSQRATMSFFGPEPPELITINIGPDETTQVPWGRMAIPALPGVDFYLNEQRHPELGMLFSITAQGPRKYRHEVEGVFRLIENELKTNSIYKGKAFDGQVRPEFLDLSGVDPDRVIYTKEVMTQLDANVWSLLRHTDKMIELGVPLKRAVLFEGKYGTGKTLAAYLTALTATSNGWSFIYCRPGRDSLEEVMATARLYQPAVVFFEDIDVVSGDNQNDDHVSKLLDIFDGVQAKGTQILCVLTTNHVNKIHKGVLRPGRLDAVIHIGELDATGLRTLVESNVPANLLGDLDWDAVTAAMEGFVPAFAKEAIDRAMRYAISRTNGNPEQLNTEDFVNAAQGLRPQLALMEEAHEGGAGATMDNLMVDAIEGVMERTRVLRGGGNWAQLAIAPATNGHS